MPQRVERWNRSYENIELSCDYARCAPCTQRVERWNRSYENIELSCDYARCAPCTYPNCQRYVRVKKTAKKAFAK